jgi:AcrR family transcriptional regulator
MGLRERQKEKRCEQILDAARRLIRSTGGTEFSMRRLADESEVSLVTPYNLFRSKSGILYALLNASLEGLVDAPDLLPAGGGQVMELGGSAAKLYSQDSAFYRPLMRFLLGVPDAEHRPRLLEQSLQRWREAIGVAVDAGVLSTRINVDFVARQLMITFIGTVELWVHEELNDEAFIVQSLYGSTLVVSAFVTEDARPIWRRRLRELESVLPSTFSAAPAAGELKSKSGAAAA